MSANVDTLDCDVAPCPVDGSDVILAGVEVGPSGSIVAIGVPPGTDVEVGPGNCRTAAAVASSEATIVTLPKKSRYGSAFCIVS